MSDKGTYLFGYSGHAYVILDTLQEKGVRVIGYFEKQEKPNNPYGIPYIGFETNLDLRTIVNQDMVFPSTGENSIRQHLVRIFEDLGLAQLNIIDPNAIVSLNVIVGLSTYVGRNAVINSLTHIGKGVIINTGVIVEHECIIKDYCHIAPNATLAGNVSIDSNVFIGAGAVVKHGVKIGENSIIGAGSVVVRDVPSNEVWLGNPAKYLKNAK